MESHLPKIVGHPVYKPVTLKKFVTLAESHRKEYKIEERLKVPRLNS